MTEQEAVNMMKYRVETASEMIGKGVDGKAFEDMEMAIKALEKQIAKKTIASGEFLILYRCPVCDEYVPIEAIYCMECGQKLDWGGEND